MIKFSLTLIFSLLIFEAFAQKDSTVYYLLNSGKIVSTKDSSDYSLVILPPDTNVDRSLSIIKEYYKNGKIKLVGNATKQDLKFQGVVVTYFPNGNKMNIKKFDNGQPIGDVTEFYPNGRFYNRKSYIFTDVKTVSLLLNNCNDPTGQVIAENGNGNWINFDDHFTQIIEEGQIDGGYKQGEWRKHINDSADLVSIYKNGEVLSTSTAPKVESKTYIFEAAEPEFPGGVIGLNKFLSKNIHYPDKARMHNTQGRVVLHFMVEPDGTLTDIKITRGIGDGCDEEALRVMKLSPLWKPGLSDGKPVQAGYTASVGFILSQ